MAYLLDVAARSSNKSNAHYLIDLEKNGSENANDLEHFILGNSGTTEYKVTFTDDSFEIFQSGKFAVDYHTKLVIQTIHMKDDSGYYVRLLYDAGANEENKPGEQKELEQYEGALPPNVSMPSNAYYVWKSEGSIDGAIRRLRYENAQGIANFYQNMYDELVLKYEKVEKEIDVCDINLTCIERIHNVLSVTMPKARDAALRHVKDEWETGAWIVRSKSWCITRISAGSWWIPPSPCQWHSSLFVMHRMLKMPVCVHR